MEPDTERGWFPVGVDRLARHDQAGLTQGMSDLEVDLHSYPGWGRTAHESVTDVGSCATGDQSSQRTSPWIAPCARDHALGPASGSTKASSSHSEGSRSASRRGHDTRARRPAVRLTKKIAVEAAHSDRTWLKKRTPYAPKSNAGYQTSSAAATTATDVACVMRSVLASPSRSSAGPPFSQLLPCDKRVSERDV
jgi:hypothetical protein